MNAIRQFLIITSVLLCLGIPLAAQTELRCTGGIPMLAFPVQSSHWRHCVFEYRGRFAHARPAQHSSDQAGWRCSASISDFS